jgi:site-specific DNA-methyltransferase (adenine-specific)
MIETIGNATLYQGDCSAVLPLIPPVDLVITSPPYNLGAAPWARLGHWKPGNASGSGGNKKWKGGAEGGAGVKYGAHEDALPWEEYVAWQRNLLSALWGKLTAGGAIFYNHKPRVIGTRLWTPLELIPPEIELRQVVVWARPGGMNYNPTSFVPTHEWIMVLAKPDFRLKSRGVSGLGDVWSMRPEKNEHPAPFPIDLPAKAIEATNAQIILDPFMGSGTTGVAAARAGKQFYGIEIEPAFYAMARQRISAASDQSDMLALTSAPSSVDRA